MLPVRSSAPKSMPGQSLGYTTELTAKLQVLPGSTIKQKQDVGETPSHPFVATETF